MRPLYLILMLFCVPVSAHEAHMQEDPSSEKQMFLHEYAVKVINNSFDQKIKPIFREKCFDCHSRETRHPWYYRLPIAKQLIDRDIREGLKHLDMTNGFPFKGHHPTAEQLDEIRETIQKGDMPPWRYRLLHPGSGLSREEKDQILRWTDLAEKKLKNPQ